MYWSSAALLTAVSSVRLVTAALAAVDELSETGIRLRLQLGVLAEAEGRLRDAWSALQDTYIDAGRIGSPLVAESRANLAALAVRLGDHHTARRLVTEAPGANGSDVLMASVRAGLAKTVVSVANQRQTLARYSAQAGSASPTALVAAAAVDLNDFQLELAVGRRKEAKLLLDRIELTAQCICATLGMNHPQTLIVRLNHATADYRLAREMKIGTASAVTALRAATGKLEAGLGADHPQTLVARGTLAAAMFDRAPRTGRRQA